MVLGSWSKYSRLPSTLQLSRREKRMFPATASAGGVTVTVPAGVTSARGSAGVGLMVGVVVSSGVNVGAGVSVSVDGEVCEGVSVIVGAGVAGGVRGGGGGGGGAQ